jgi:hypothetical protein
MSEFGSELNIVIVVARASIRLSAVRQRLERVLRR